MRLLFFSTAFPQPGDPTRALYNLKMCEALAADHDLTIVAPVPWTRAGAPRRLPAALSRVHYPLFFYPPGVLRGTHAWWMWNSVRTTVRRAIVEAPLDAVVSYWTWPDGAVAARIARDTGAPAVMMVGGSDVLTLTAAARHRLRVARTLAQAAAVVTVGERLRSAVAELGVARQRIAVIRRGVDPAVFAPGSRIDARRRLGVPDSETVLLWVGRLAHVKGPDLLLDALEELRLPPSTPWRCVIVGHGSLMRGLRRRVRHSRLRDHVWFAGALLPPQLADWYRAADAVVVSSRSEGMPNVLYEAKACGARVVAMQAGNIGDLLDEGDRLVPACDARGLADALAEVVRSPIYGAPATLPTWHDSAALLAELIAQVRGGGHHWTSSPAAAGGSAPASVSGAH